MEFEVGREYQFVRTVAGKAERVRVIWFGDGSGGLSGDCPLTVWHESPEEWRLVIADLEARGFVLDPTCTH